MTLDKDTYTFSIKLPKSTFANLYMEGLLDEYDSIENALVGLINDYTQNFCNEPEIAYDSFHNQIESMVTYSRVLAFVQKHIDIMFQDLDSFFRYLAKLNGKICLSRCISEEVTPGRILRLLKSDSSWQLSQEQLRYIIQWSTDKFPADSSLIIKAYAEQTCARIRANSKKTHNFAEA